MILAKIMIIESGSNPRTPDFLSSTLVISHWGRLSLIQGLKIKISSSYFFLRTMMSKYGRSSQEFRDLRCRSGPVIDLQYNYRQADFLLYLASNKTYTSKEDGIILWSTELKVRELRFGNSSGDYISYSSLSFTCSLPIVFDVLPAK